LTLLLQDVVVIERSGEVLDIGKSLVEGNAEPVVVEFDVGVGGADRTYCRQSSVVDEEFRCRGIYYSICVLYGLEKP